ncbi:hypothetical protein EUA93_07590 [Nocardioides oleivorans]|uniref:LppX_LprAFG lipoprotein n=1 Tax=Nocardioides oleivorans TaxID=273676 RepID=A0A4Q2S1J7_9ACTN|nr:hypothetical protein [Nocardioides oleivorans]RYB94214.1 hypothetical protein EUA93_07590 [Nocardioides oleivorans]
MRRSWHVVAAVVLAGAVSGCGVVDDLRATGFSRQSGLEIATAASEAMADVTSMRLTGQLRVNGNPIVLDLSLGDRTCTGSMRFDKGHFAVRRVGGRAWVKGDATAFSRIASTPLSAAATAQLSTTWIPADDEAILGLCDLDRYLESFSLSGSEQGGSGKGKGKGKDEAISFDDVTVGEETTQDGDRVVEVTTTPTETSWVLSEAPHYVIRVEDRTPRDGGFLNLSEFNRDVHVEAPRGKDVLRP